jgi:hypothetical protein
MLVTLTLADHPAEDWQSLQATSSVAFLGRACKPGSGAKTLQSSLSDDDLRQRCISSSHNGLVWAAFHATQNNRSISARSCSLMVVQDSLYRRRRRTHQRDVLLRHADVFKGYIHPYLRKETTECDNYSVKSELSRHILKDGEAHASFESCRLACESNSMCLQFSYRTANCLVSNEVRLGRKTTLQCLEYSTVASKCGNMKKDLTMQGTELWMRSVLVG